MFRQTQVLCKLFYVVQIIVITAHYSCYRKFVQILFRIYEVLTTVYILPTRPTAVVPMI